MSWFHLLSDVNPCWWTPLTLVRINYLFYSFLSYCFWNHFFDFLKCRTLQFLWFILRTTICGVHDVLPHGQFQRCARESEQTDKQIDRVTFELIIHISIELRIVGRCIIFFERLRFYIRYINSMDHTRISKLYKLITVLFIVSMCHILNYLCYRIHIWNSLSNHQTASRSESNDSLHWKFYD